MTPKEFVARLQNHFGPPEHAANGEALAADYAAALNGTDPAVLQEASDRLLRAHTYRSWPTIGECRQAAEAAATERSRNAERTARHTSRVDAYEQPTPEQRARVNDLVKGTAARIAAHAKRCEGRRVLDVVYEDLHGQPYRVSDWRGLTEEQKQAKIHQMRAAAEDRRQHRLMRYEP